MKKTKFTLLAIMLIFSGLAFAQEKVDRMPKVSGFAQLRFDMNFNHDFDLKTNTFYLQRVCINFDGKLTQRLSYRVGGDFIRRPALTDAYLKYTLCDAFSIQAGQMKTPLTIENQFNPAFDCEAVDYGTVIKQLTGYEGGITGIGALGRDIGVMIGGSLFKVENNKGESFGIIDYKLGVFNGNGINNKDNNNRKDIIGRIDIHPWVKELTISGSYQNGEYINDSVMQGANNRWSAGIQYKSERFVFRTEYIGGETGMRIYDNPVNFKNKPFNSTGCYAVVGYWIDLGKSGRKIMPVLRCDYLDRNTSISKGAVSYYAAGFTYLHNKHVNFKVNYQYVEPETGKGNHNVLAILNYRF